MGGHIVDRLGAILKAQEEAIDQFAHGPFETGSFFFALTQDGITNQALKVFIMERKPVL